MAGQYFNMAKIEKAGALRHPPTHSQVTTGQYFSLAKIEKAEVEDPG
jgi:hypothetical protein